MENILHKSQFSDVFGNGNIVEICWKSKTEFLDNDSFKEEISAFAKVAESYNPKSIFIDALEYRHAVNLKLQEWHDTNIIPRYENAGVKKIAFIFPKDLISQLSIEQVFDEDTAKEKLKVKYFADEIEAKDWLNN